MGRCKVLFNCALLKLILSLPWNSRETGYRFLCNSYTINVNVQLILEERVLIASLCIWEIQKRVCKQEANHFQLILLSSFSFPVTEGV